jgi:transcriptional regulator with XRE-family HTH domain
MPRPPKQPHVLRTALKELGMSQKELAEHLDIAPVTIEKFLNGKLDISKFLGFRISEATGLDFEQLILNTDPENPRILNDAQKREARIRQGVKWTKQLIDASLQASVEIDEFAYQMDLRIEAADLIHKHGLAARTKKLLGLTPKESLYFAGPGGAPLAEFSNKRRRRKP